MLEKRTCSHGVCSGVVTEVIDLENLLETASGVLELVEVEGLGLVELVPVRCPELIRVLVPLGPPGGSIPQLTVGLVASHKSVRAILNFQILRFVELRHAACFTTTEVWFVVGSRVLVAGSERAVSVLLLFGLLVGRGLLVSAPSEPAGGGLERFIEPGVERQSEPRYNG